MNLYYTSVLCFMAFFQASDCINWDGNNWAMRCDFAGNDIRGVRAAGEKCGQECSNAQGCTHWSFTNYNGGTCWLKRGRVSKSDAKDNYDSTSACGINGEESTGTNDGLGGKEEGANDGSSLNKGQLMWSDEFNNAGSPSRNNWRADTAGNAWKWGNNEEQCYTTSGNSRNENGNLVIESRREYKDNFKYTSGRLISNKAFKYGIFEMRAKLPRGRGIWSAFWLLAHNGGDWPSCGELDIMENVGYDPKSIHSTIHTGRYNHIKNNQKASHHQVQNPFDEYHVYSMDWTPTHIKSYIDGKHYFTYNKPDSSHEAWPFNNEFNILLNVAVGGNWGGSKGVDDSIFPTYFIVDYVRQYNNGYVV